MCAGRYWDYAKPHVYVRRVQYSFLVVVLCSDVEILAPPKLLIASLEEYSRSITPENPGST